MQADILAATATHLVLDACAVGLAATHAVSLGVLLWLDPAGSSHVQTPQVRKTVALQPKQYPQPCRSHTYSK